MPFPQRHRPLGAPTHHTMDHGKHQLNAGTEVLHQTWHNTVNLRLSSTGLPLAPGYSQSRSSPSKPYFLSSLIEDWANIFLLACVDTIVVNLGKESDPQYINILYSAFMFVILLENTSLLCPKVPASHGQQCFKIWIPVEVHKCNSIVATIHMYISHSTVYIIYVLYNQALASV